MVCVLGRTPVLVGQSKVESDVCKPCALVCWVLEWGEPGKTLLVMVVGNTSAVPRAQEMRAANRLELVWSEAVLAQAAPSAQGQGVA